jgi:hypothetical protein
MKPSKGARNLFLKIPDTFPVPRAAGLILSVRPVPRAAGLIPAVRPLPTPVSPRAQAGLATRLRRSVDWASGRK